MNDIIKLRKKLHTLAEPSRKEYKTAEAIKDFLRKNTSLEITECDGWFYALHYEGANLKNIAFRADMDAIYGKNGYFHGCGHDGHSAALCGLALALEGKTTGKNIYLIFQLAEEIGTGAKLCSRIIKEKYIEKIYGFHNIPGFKEGVILLKKNIFAMTSVGMTIRLKGRQCHAAYPETGINPAYAIGELISSFENIKGNTIISVVNIDLGKKNFGICPGDGEVSLTFRAETENELMTFRNKLKDIAEKTAAKYGLELNIDYFDFFPETANSEKSFSEVLKVIDNNFEYEILKEPMRWSEDFGYYLKECEGMFFGIGDGEEYPGLHTEEFEFNDNILKTAIKLFLKLTEV